VVPTVPLSGVDLVEQPAEPYGNSKNAMINHDDQTGLIKPSQSNQKSSKPAEIYNSQSAAQNRCFPLAKRKKGGRFEVDAAPSGTNQDDRRSPTAVYTD